MKFGDKEDCKEFVEYRISDFFSNKIDDSKFEPKKLWQSLTSLGCKIVKTIFPLWF